MTDLFAWERLNMILSGVFFLLYTFAFVPWRTKARAAVLVIPACVLSVLEVLFFGCVFVPITPFIQMCLLPLIWVVVAFFLSRYRDARTVSVLLSAWTLNLSASIVARAYILTLDSVLLRVVVIALVHTVFLLCILFRIRGSLFSIMERGKKGWVYGCILPAMPLITLGLLTGKQEALEQNPTMQLSAVIASITILLAYITIADLCMRVLSQRKKAQMSDALSAQARSAEKQLLEADRRERQNAILRHDLRHFADLITSCIQNEHYNEALESARSLLRHPAMQEPQRRYCNNPSLNALLSSYAQKAADADAGFHVSAMPADSCGVDAIELAMMLSNLLENALNACAAQPEGSPRAIRVKLYMAGRQLFISIANTCSTPVLLDEKTGLPRAQEPKPGHGLGMLSVHNYLTKYHAQTDCTQQDGWFQIRIVVSATEKPQKHKIVRSHRANRSIIAINLLVSTLIIIGFTATGLAANYSYNRLFKADIEAVSALTSENISASLGSLMDRPINISLAMASDTLLRELVREEAPNPRAAENAQMTETIRQYLAAYEREYGFDSVAFTSSRTGAYYHHQEGITRIVSPYNREDAWYFSFLNESSEYKLNIDYDKATDYRVTIFADCKLYDTDGTVLGVLGVGIKTPHIQKLLKQSEQDYHVHTYLIDESGEIQLSSGLTKLQNVNLFEDPRFADMAQAIVSNRSDTEHRWYTNGNLDGYVISKYIPGLNWYLVVEKDTTDLQKTVHSHMKATVLLMTVVVLVVVVIITSILTKYHGALVGRAECDPLTGLRNRTCFEQDLRMYGGRLADYVQFGIGVYDLHMLRRVNDVLGYPAGDAYLVDFTALLNEVFIHCPVFRIGGSEFAVVFLNMDEEEARAKHQLIHAALQQCNYDSVIPMQASFGCAFQNNGELASAEQVFAEACRLVSLEKKDYTDQPKEQS